VEPAGTTALEGDGRSRTTGIWAVPLLGLFAIWLWLAFSSGGSNPRNWLLPSVVVGLLGLVLALLAAYPRRPRQLSFLVLGLLVFYALWVLFSALWADSSTGVWIAGARTLTYLAVFALAVVFLTDPTARRVFRYLLMAATLFLLVALIWKLWSSHDVSSMFLYSRLSYPVTYPNNAAALFLLGFWPLMWLAAGSKEAAPVRGVALGVATGLLGLAIMTQSRGAIWSLAITLVFMFVVSPARLRTLCYLIVPGLLMAYEFPSLNRYWEEGAQTVGGAAGARTILVASVVAGFVGMILALLERWIKVSRRMRVVFGSVVFAGVVALIVWGSIALTADVGGPIKWLSQTWDQFTESADEDPSGQDPPGSASTSRFTMVGSNGRVEIWRVAWREFETEPALGVGANSFVYGYDRLRASGTSQSQDSHSLFLQVVAETGIVGGVVFVGSVLLVLGGVLWPHCTAGWRRARETWLKPGRPLRSRVCSARWGNDPVAYGWEMALLVALAYWLVHGSVEWLWPMAGVTVPAFLILAAVLAEVDARAEALWPSWARRLRVSRSDATVEPEPAPSTAEIAPADRAGEPLPGESEMPDRQFEEGAVRRTLGRRRSEQSGDVLRPPGALSMGFRLGLVTLSLLVIMAAGLPYLALQFQESALALARTNGVKAIDRAAGAHWLQPADPSPYLTQATIYENAARRALEAGHQTGAVLDNLALAIHACDRAIALEPADWSIRYRAGVSTINLLVATEHAAGRSLQLDASRLVAGVPGFMDLSGLVSADGAPLPSPGEDEGSLAGSESTRAAVEYYRGMSGAELADLARVYLDAARERNPLAGQIGEAAALVEQLLGP